MRNRQALVCFPHRSITGKTTRVEQDSLPGLNYHIGVPLVCVNTGYPAVLLDQTRNSRLREYRDVPVQRKFQQAALERCAIDHPAMTSQFGCQDIQDKSQCCKFASPCTARHQQVCSFISLDGQLGKGRVH